MNCLTVAIAMGASGQTQILMDNREYPRSVMPDALCCWVFHLPPTLEDAWSCGWDSAVT
jgi:hypothetical protein